MSFAKSQNTRKHIERAEVVHTSCIDELHAHLACKAELKLNKFALRCCAKWIIEQQHAGLTLSGVLLTTARAEFRPCDIKQSTHGHLFTFTKSPQLLHFFPTRTS